MLLSKDIFKTIIIMIKIFDRWSYQKLNDQHEIKISFHGEQMN